MRVLRRVTLIALLAFSATPAFADDSATCQQLSKEVQVLKEQQDKLFRDMKMNQVTEKKSFSTMEGLMDVLAAKFPDLKDTFKKFKDIYDTLGKTSN